MAAGIVTSDGIHGRTASIRGPRPDAIDAVAAAGIEELGLAGGCPALELLALPERQLGAMDEDVGDTPEAQPRQGLGIGRRPAAALAQPVRGERDVGTVAVDERLP